MVLGIPARDGELVPLVEQEPLLALAFGRAHPVAAADIRPHDREAALELLAEDSELELAVTDRLAGISAGRLRFERAPVPHDHVARAVLARRDHPLEVEILDRMILDVDGHAPHRRIE